MRLSSDQQGLIKIIAFRRQMGVGLSKGVLQKYWPSINRPLELMNSLRETDITDDNYRDFYIDEKVKLVKSKIKRLKPLINTGLIKYVGISGSVASGMYRKGEDIDIFVVVKNYSVWLVRGLIKLLLSKDARMFEDNEIENTMCFNLLVEERALAFEPTIFNLHELIHLVSVVNEDYLETILGANPWISKYLETDHYSEKSNPDISYLSFIVDLLAFLSQWGYMSLLRHSPNRTRLLRGYSEGRIQFYPDKFQKEKSEAYLFEYNQMIKE